MPVLLTAQRFRGRPSEILGIDDCFTAYCFDEACCFILSQLEEGKRPFFRRESAGSGGASGNSQTIALLRNLGAEVKNYD